MSISARCLVVALLFGLCACAPEPVTPTPAPHPTPAPTATVAPLSPPTPTPRVSLTAESDATPKSTDSGAFEGFTPTGRTVWNTVIGTSRSTGTCTQGSVLPVYGLVQVTALDDGGIEWKSQEPKPYRMERIAASTYRYSGPDSIGSGQVTMTVRFVDDQNLQVTREFVPDNDPRCTHIHEYGGVFQWSR